MGLVVVKTVVVEFEFGNRWDGLVRGFGNILDFVSTFLLFISA